MLYYEIWLVLTRYWKNPSERLFDTIHSIFKFLNTTLNLRILSRRVPRSANLVLRVDGNAREGKSLVVLRMGICYAGEERQVGATRSKARVSRWAGGLVGNT